MWIHALLGSAGAQASSYRHIRPEHLNNSLPYVSKHEAMPHRCMCSLFTLSGDGGASIHGLSGTEDVRASPFGCIRPEMVNRFMLHVAAHVMHSQLLGSDASRSLPCLASQEARVDVDAWPAWHRLHTGVVVLVH